MTSRRGFLAAMFAAAAAPAFVKAESLMKIVVPKKEIVLLDDFVVGIGVGDFTAEMHVSKDGMGWNHLAVVRKKNEILTYRNGILVPAEDVRKDWTRLDSSGESFADQFSVSFEQGAFTTQRRILLQ